MEKKSILLVDDNEAVSESLGEALSAGGYDVSLVESGEDAIVRLNDAYFNLVIADLKMGRVDGIQVAEEAKRIDPLIAVILVSGHGDMATAINAMRLGADDYLIKPCTVEELFFRISRCFEKQGFLEQLRIKNQKLEQEIMKRRQSEEALRQSEKRFRLALDATSDGVWDRNLITGEVYYGENWAKILGYSLDEIKRENLTWEKLLHPEDIVEAMAMVRNHLDGKTTRYVAEFRMRNKAGGWQWILARGRVVEWDNNNRPLRFVGTHKDITDRKRVEEALKQHSEKTKLFAHSVAHDLKNPAITIYGLTRLLHQNYREFLDEKGKKSCDQVMKSSEQIAALVDKINSFVATKEAVLQVERVPLQEILVMIREAYSSQLSARRIRLLETGPFPEIMIDRLGIMRLLRNLIDNGLKYGGDGLSEIEIGYRESDAFHIIFVRDNGAGLPEEEGDRIFEPYRRGECSATVEGTGLGLAIVKEIADQHKGAAWIEHGPGQGVTFNVSIAKVLSPLPQNPSANVVYQMA
jgi:PAS domain S-box-containing protein